MHNSDSNSPQFDQPLNKNHFLANFQGMDDLVSETIKSFLEELPSLVSAIQSAIENKNQAELKLSAHTLKGATSIFYAEPCKFLAGRLEKMGETQITSDIDNIFQQLKIELVKLTQELQTMIVREQFNEEKVILVVDDSEFDRGLLVKALSRKGSFTIAQATSGTESLDILKNRRIDLILMDIMMPGTFGSEVLVKIREQYNPIELPVIMVTSKSDTYDVIQCLQRGANDYITKPVNFDVAISRISTHLKLAELSREMSKLKEMVALDAMITTYNHEINNPLAIAVGCISSLESENSKNVERLKTAVWRIAEVVKKIREVTLKREAEYGNYAEGAKFIKI